MQLGLPPVAQDIDRHGQGLVGHLAEYVDLEPGNLEFGIQIRIFGPGRKQRTDRPADQLMVLLAGVHALRAGQIATLRLDDVDITLIERNRTHVWKPKLHEIAAGSMAAGTTARAGSAYSMASCRSASTSRGSVR